VVALRRHRLALKHGVKVTQQRMIPLAALERDIDEDAMGHRDHGHWTSQYSARASDNKKDLRMERAEFFASLTDWRLSSDLPEYGRAPLLPPHHNLLVDARELLREMK
jgi:hypothetical protein